MDTQKEKAIIVHMYDKQIKFSQMPGGLYARQLKNNNDKTINYNHDKQKETQEVKRLQNALGTSSNADLKTTVTTNMIQKNQIIHEDINLAERTFGKQLAV